MLLLRTRHRQKSGHSRYREASDADIEHCGTRIDALQQFTESAAEGFNAVTDELTAIQQVLRMTAALPRTLRIALPQEHALADGGRRAADL